MHMGLGGSKRPCKAFGDSQLRHWAEGKECQLCERYEAKLKVYCTLNPHCSCLSKTLKLQLKGNADEEKTFSSSSQPKVNDDSELLLLLLLQAALQAAAAAAGTNSGLPSASYEKGYQMSQAISRIDSVRSIFSLVHNYCGSACYEYKKAKRYS